MMKTSFFLPTLLAFGALLNTPSASEPLQCGRGATPHERSICTDARRNAAIDQGRSRIHATARAIARGQRSARFASELEKSMTELELFEGSWLPASAFAPAVTRRRPAERRDHRPPLRLAGRKS